MPLLMEFLCIPYALIKVCEVQVATDQPFVLPHPQKHEQEEDMFHYRQPPPIALYRFAAKALA